MTQEHKELLLKDLCSRLPYRVKVGTTGNYRSLENEWDILWHNPFTADVKLIHCIRHVAKIVNFSEVKPYLFPLSSMTEEQREELQKLYFDYIPDEIFNDTEFVYHYDCTNLIDWLNKNHFDYRGLIEKGLAIDATGLNIY